jgi:hypothetical protein
MLASMMDAGEREREREREGNDMLASMMDAGERDMRETCWLP